MLNTIILICAVTSVFGLNSRVDDRILGGTDAAISEHPYQVSIQRYGGHICAGVIIREDIVLTVAHCLERHTSFSLTVRAGSAQWNSGGVLSNVHTYRLHESYNPTTMENDIAIIRLATELKFNENISAIALDLFPMNSTSYAIISGWGSQTFADVSLADNLQVANTLAISQEYCASTSFSHGQKIKKNMICAYGDQVACYGDDGGSMVRYGYNGRAYLVGIFSWSYNCGAQAYPSVYTNVGGFHSWILNAAQFI